MVRFPGRVWLSLKKGWGALLRPCVVDGRLIWWWSHACVSAAVRARYLTTTAPIKVPTSDARFSTRVGRKAFASCAKKTWRTSSTITGRSRRDSATPRRARS